MLVYSLDMAKTRIYERLWCLESGLDHRTLFSGNKLSEPERAAAKEASVRLYEDLLRRLRVVERDFSFEERSPYDTNDEPAKPVRKGLTSSGILKDCGNLMAATGASDVLIVIDLFQKMDPRGEIADSLARDHYRLDQLDQVRKASVLPERPHGFPIMVISEIRKDAAKASLDRDDLKGDGRMASDADVVMLDVAGRKRHQRRHHPHHAADRQGPRGRGPWRRDAVVRSHALPFLRHCADRSTF